jgi:hypothetical protein
MTSEGYPQPGGARANPERRDPDGIRWPHASYAGNGRSAKESIS